MAENGKVEKLTPNQTRALGALLSSSSVAQAAKEAKVGERTLHRWLHSDEGFRAAYQEQRRAALDSVVGLLESSMYMAIETLVDAMQTGNTNNRIRAATVVLENGLKSLQFEQIELKELEEIQQRLERLEDAAREDAW